MQREPDKFGVPASISVMMSLHKQEKDVSKVPPEMLTNFQACAFDHQSETETVSSNSFRHKYSGTETLLGESDGHPDNNS